MPKVERTIEIKASQERIFEIVDDTENYSKWNIVVNEVTKLGEDKYFLKTNVGDVTSTTIESVPPKHVSANQEGSPMTSLGYVLKPKGGMVEATLWAEYDDPELEYVLGIAGDMLLKSLKKYAEYIESGGNSEEYDKK